MAQSAFISPREIYYGPGSIEVLGNVPEKRVLVVTDRTVRDLGLVERVVNILHANNAETLVFDKLEAEPEKSTVWSILPLAQEFQPDLFIGLGGGSCMDAGKIAWALYEHPEFALLPLGKIVEELRSRMLRIKARYVAISTTSGTGSEVTPVAVVSDHDTDPPSKPGLVSLQLIPDIAIADPELTVSMPPEVTANTGFDALAHATECYVLGGRAKNNLIESLALGAAKTIVEWLPRAVVEGKNIEVREKMHLAALQAGLAFANGGLGFIHTLSHPLGAIFRIPHGRALALLLNASFAHVYPANKTRLSSMATALGITGESDRIKVSNLLASLEQLKKQIGIPLAIKDTGLEEAHFLAQLDTLVEGYRSFSLNVVHSEPMSAAEAREIFIHALNGTWSEIK